MSSKKNNQNKMKEGKKYLVEVALRLIETPYGPLRQTRKRFENKINQMSKSIADLYTFIIYTEMYSILIYPLSLGVDDKAEDRNLTNLLRQNEVLTFTIRSCVNEFFVFLTELQTAAYSGAARTLRHILETAVEACEFQTQNNRPTIKTIKDIANNKEKLQSFMMHHNSWISFMERYKIYKETKRIAPSYKELVKKLNSREMFREAPQILDDLKSIYELLSDYVHPSLLKIERQIERKTSPFPSFNREEFEAIYKLGLKTLDMVQFIYIEATSHYFNFKDSKEFLTDLSKRIKFEPKQATSFLTLPYSKKLSRGIIWSSSKE